jgi:membrane fusion protein (multidrug efflux system)
MRVLLIALVLLLPVSGCSKEKKEAPAAAAAEVTVIQIAGRDTPVSFEFVGQTESSHQVEIRARVAGFLDKRVYAEGTLVKAGEVMFKQDPKPFQAQLAAAKGALAQQVARLQTARDNLARVRPLAAENALSQKDLSDAIGTEQAAAAAVDTARANVETAQLNLGYTTIASPVTGLSSFAQVQDGAYVSTGNSLLTTVEQVDPIWINFTLSENEILTLRSERERGQLRTPERGSYEIEAVLADGTVFAHTGRITFANASYNQQTGTFLIRATFPNPDALLRPGQFIRVRAKGAVRPNAILVPQQAVLNGAQGHFVWVIDKEGKAQVRPVQVGPWHKDEWFIVGGLTAGETVAVDGVIKLAPGVPVKAVPAAAKQAEAEPGEPPAQAQKGADPETAKAPAQTQKRPDPTDPKK